MATDRPLQKRLRRLLRVLGITLAGLVGLLFVVLVAAAGLLQGERLARFLGAVLPPLQGKLELRAVYWKPRLFLDLLTDTPTPIVVEGLRITDPEGTDVLRAPRLAVKVPPRSAIGLKIYLKDLELGPGSFWRFAAMKDGENGFLASLQPAKKSEPEPEPEPESDGGGFLFQIVNAQLDGLTAQFDFPGAWGLELRDIVSPASFILDGPFVGWDAPGLHARGGGYLKIIDDVLPFDDVKVTRVATTREWPNDIFLEVGEARTGRSRLTGKGFFTGIYGYGFTPETAPPAGIDLHIELDDAADALTAVAARRAISGLRLGGDRVRVVADLKDAFERLKINGRLDGLDAAFDTYQALGLSVAFGLDLGVPMAVTVQRLHFGAPGGGGLTLEAGLRGDQAQARLRLDGFTTDSYAPPGLRRLAAGTVQGGLRLEADLARKSAEVADLDLRVRRRFAAGLPRTARLHGNASASPEGVSTRGLALEVPGARAAVKGRLDLVRQAVALGLRATAFDLPRVLGALGLPPLARRAALSVDVRGTTAAPQGEGTARVEGIATAEGLPQIESLQARFGLARGTARIDSLTADAFGGRIEGQGTLRLFERTVDRLLRSPVLAFRLDGRQIELGTLVSGGLVRGAVDLTVKAEGPLNKLRASVVLPPGAELELVGERWSLGGIDIETDLRSVEVKLLRLSRQAGGKVEVRGRMALGGKRDMTWEVAVEDLPLGGLPGVKDANLGVGGRLSLHLAASGTLAHPSLSGDLSLAGVEARGVRLGDGKLTFTPTADGGVAVAGQLFDRFRVSGTAAQTAEGPRVAASVGFDKLVLEELVPDLTRFGDARGRLSGAVSLQMAPGGPSIIEARLTELALSAAREVTEADGTRVVRRLNVRNGNEVRALVAGSHILLDRTRLVTDGGEFKLFGELDGETLAAEVSGQLNLDLLQPFISDQAERLTGDVALALKVAGTRARPLAEGSVTIASPLRAKLVGFEPEITVPSGAIRLSPQLASISDLALEVEGARLTLRGEARFDVDQKVTGLQVGASGEVNARLLESLAGSAISDASGRARVHAQIEGTPEDPRVQARIELGQMQFRLRDLGRDVEVEGGIVELTSQELLLKNIRARVDGQGRLGIGTDPRFPGRIAIRKLVPALELGDVMLPLRGERLSFAASNTVAMDDIGLQLAVTGNTEAGFQLKGEIQVSAGRYLQDFTVRNLMISPDIDESSVRPFYEGKPLLENLALDLRLRTVGDSFLVRNNLTPEINVAFDLRVGGTLSAPTLSGDVRPTDGRFRIYGVRGEFVLVPNVNYITFVATKSMAAGDTPELNLEAESVFSDVSGQDHLVRMRIRGPVRQAAIDLSTAGGLDRNQTLLLLLSGRTTEAEPTFGTRSPTLGTNIDVIGQLSRDSVADFLEPYIDDTLQLLTGGRLNLRPTVGADGFELRLAARATRQVDLQVSLLRGFQNQRRYRAESSVWLMDYLTLRGFAEQLTLTPYQGITEELRSLNLELTLDFPIRFILP